MKPKIYFICPNNKLISGGVKQIYRQVEVLNNHGIDAYVLLDKEPKQWWFKSQAAIAYSPYIYYMLQHILLNRMLTLRRKLKRWRLSKKSVSIAPKYMVQSLIRYCQQTERLSLIRIVIIHLTSTA